MWLGRAAIGRGPGELICESAMMGTQIYLSGWHGQVGKDKGHWTRPGWRRAGVGARDRPLGFLFHTPGVLLQGAPSPWSHTQEQSKTLRRKRGQGGLHELGVMNPAQTRRGSGFVAGSAGTSQGHREWGTLPRGITPVWTPLTVYVRRLVTARPVWPRAGTPGGWAGTRAVASWGYTESRRLAGLIPTPTLALMLEA